MAKLEALAYTFDSSTEEAFNIRTEEAEITSTFIEQTKQIKSRGQIVLEETNNSQAMIWYRIRAKDYIIKVGDHARNKENSKVIIISYSRDITDSFSLDTKIKLGNEISSLIKTWF